METKARGRILKLPVCLGWTREEIKEINPHLSVSQIEAIFNAAYELQVGFDLDAEKFVSVETVTFYKRPRAQKGV